MTRKAPRSGSIAPPIDYSPSGAVPKAARLVELGLKRGKGPPPPVFRFDCAPDHISVANPALFISHRTSPQSGPLGKAVQRSCSAWAALFFWIAAARPRSTRYLWSGVIG